MSDEMLDLSFEFSSIFYPKATKNVSLFVTFFEGKIGIKSSNVSIVLGSNSQF